MFINKKEQDQEQEKIKQLKPETPEQLSGQKSLLESFANKQMIFIAVAVILLLVLGTFFYILFFQKPKTQPEPTPTNGGQPANGDGEDDGSLPGGLSGDGNGDNGDITNIQAEKLTFAQFYQKIKEDFVGDPKSLDLPINIKTDVANYHIISRKINLDPYIEELNNNGFVIFNNPFTSQANNFYNTYDILSQREIPILVTSDFIIYYYQTIFKEVFKEIESQVFYEDLWQISKNFYNIANNRYRERYNRLGIVNDPVLEGMRRETAYFATALELLKAKSNQITLAQQSDTQFTQEEAERFSFSLPAYLQEDVQKEINLISRAGNVSKSPVLLYQRDYQVFNVPNEYGANFKLNNYYLTARWFNSIFPLYYQSESCPECLLDQDDWLINMITACLITNDFSVHQEYKNQWARIYKVISFFAGLRQDLTYLNYQEALVNIFDNNYNIEEIFSDDNPNREEELTKLQEKISQFKFYLIEGSINREDSTRKPYLGLKILQESFWPNQFLFNELTYPQVNTYLSEQLDQNLITQCRIDTFQNRCQGIALDIINLVYPVPESNNYFQKNINYQNYYTQVNKLRNQLNDFNLNSWYNNNYWASLSTIKSFLQETNSTNSFMYIYNSDIWQEKNINTALSAWVNLQIPADKLSTRLRSTGSSLGQISTASDFDYVEPNLVLTNELIANSEMLAQMLLALKATRSNSFTNLKLFKLIDELESLKSIMQKELNNEILDYDDREIINSIVKQFEVKTKGHKYFTIKYSNSSKSISESIDGVKLLMIVYNRGDKKVFAIGPIFNYQEK